MGFVKTAEEIRKIEKAISAVEFNGGKFIAIEFESDPDFIKRTLPPGLEPTGENRMSAMTCDFGGGSCGPFKGGAVYLPARHGDIVGRYVLAMYMDTDNAVLFGRDIYGEPKKIAVVEQVDEGTGARGTVSRGGTTLIEIGVRFEQEGETEGLAGQDFNYKTSLAADGIGLAGDPILTLASQRMTSVTRHQVGPGTLRLNGTPHDPLNEIPVGQIYEARFIESDVISSSHALTTVPAGEFLPYAYGRMPDWSVFLAEWNAHKGR
jgi:acetoacetate decarboxylase